MISRIKQILSVKAQNNKSKFARDLRMNIRTVTQYVEGESKPSADFLTNILSAYTDISAEWLMRGEGEMTNAQIVKDYTQVFNPKYTEKNIENEVINLYDINAAANLKTLLAAKGQYILGKIVIPNAPKCDGALHVCGDSMYPLLKSGGIVAYKEITPDLQNIFWGEMYVVDMCVDGDDYLVVKYVQHSDKGDDWIKLVSYNQYYQPKDFPISCIRAMALVKLSIRMNTIK